MAILKATKLYVKQISKSKRTKKALWFTREVITVGKEKMPGCKRYKETGSIAQRDSYKIRQKEAKHIINAAKASKDEEMAKSVKEGNKNVFRYISDIKKNNWDNNYIRRNKAVAVHFNGYFFQYFRKVIFTIIIFFGQGITSSCKGSSPVFLEVDVLHELLHLRLN